MEMIEFKHVTKTYDGNDALIDVSVKINKGDFVFLVGPSGAGKSTFIKLILKEIDADEGSIIVKGEEVTKMSNRKIPRHRRNIGIVFQDFRLLPQKTVYENVAFALEVIEVPPKKIQRSVPAALNLVGLAHKAKSMPNGISGGEQQRTAIARAIVNNPALVLADEPTGNLDPRNSEEIMDVLDAINRRGTTVIVATHDRDIVDEMQKRVIHIEDGVIVRDSQEGGYDDED